MLKNKKVIGQFGTPYHGILENGVITFPNGQKITQPGNIELFRGFSVPISSMPVSNGDTELFALPNHPPVIRTLEEQTLDKARNFQWTNKVLVSQDRIGSIQLSSGWILYADPNNNTWLLNVDLSAYNDAGNRRWNITVELQKLFGRISSKKYPSLYRTLLDLDIPAENAAAGSLLRMDNLTLSRNTSGSEVLINLYMQGGLSRNTITGCYLVGVKRLRIEGTGIVSEDETTHGEGITVALESYADFKDVYQYANTRIPMIAQNYAFSKINTKTEMLSGPAVPSLCETHHQIDTWALGAVPEGSAQYQKQFIGVNNVKPITNWYGYGKNEDCKLRYFFDADNTIHFTRIRRTKSELKKDTFTFSGQGKRETGPNAYIHANGVCVPNGLEVFTEDNTAQCDEIHEFKITENWALYLNHELINDAPTLGHSIQTFRSVYKMHQGLDGATNTQDNYTLTRKSALIANQQVRNYQGDMVIRNKSGYDPYYPNPFEGVQLISDDPGGVWPHYEVTQICNQLVTLNLKRNFSISAYQSPYTFHTFALAGPGIKDNATYSAMGKFGEWGSYNSVTGEVLRYWIGGSRKVWV